MGREWKDRLRKRWLIWKLKAARAKLQLHAWHLEIQRKWLSAKIAFWEWVATGTEPPTPEQSEALTGIEVRNNDE